MIEADANERIVWHFNNIEKENVPMFLLSTAAHKLKQSYAGKKYLIFQKDYPKAEEYAKEHGLTLYETGGSVMTTALDIAIRMGCKKIVFLGLDLAYTGNYAHAAGTSRREIPEGSTDLRMVEAIGGEMLYTSRSLTMYRKWIERRIARERASDIAFIDASEGGARIKGTQIKTLKEVIADEKNTCHHTGQEWL